jgi:hypothetical protein
VGTELGGLTGAPGSERQSEEAQTSKPGIQRRSVAWATNLAAPYRRPIWDFIAEEVDLTVYLLEGNTVFAKNRGNRGEKWANTENPAYTTVEAPTWRLSRGEVTLYVANMLSWIISTMRCF